ncbi:sodium/calcium exchanger 3-like isoform X2 [Limulus polyphemus]|uniref:Sodium/calcium exchanger 3-like isoform X2 n=1 Tax=Limulus polyphemus TaxID=6850 RepID=A0ABM1BA26_LIMPO|nr:sodium/calcium exchanger 3-like isoform X2 [Limulus polyphemus]
MPILTEDRTKWLTSTSWIVLISLVIFTTPVEADNSTKCKEGLIFPLWLPNHNLSTGDVVARGIVYFIGLCYMFVGVSVIADRFMASIEVITSKEKEVVIKKPNGEKQTITVRIWNETVSNLTLMALGSSAPEILLSIIEVYGQNFEAGELGPGTIVGSAAFNMFVIIGLCVYVIPNNECRRIKHLRVFFVTMIWSVFAYIWLYLILTWLSYGVIEVWEGLTTFLFFPATVLTAYIADRKLLIYKFLSKKYRMNKRGVIVGGEGENVEMQSASKTNHIVEGGFKVFEEEENDEIREFEEHRREYINILRELRRKHPHRNMEDIEVMAREEILNKGPKSRAFYRIQATRKLTGGGNLMKRKVEKQEMRKELSEEQIVKDDKVYIFFNPGHYTVMENVGEFAVNVTREGNMSHTVCVDFQTEDGTAEAGSDYDPVAGTLVFRPGEAQKHIFISVVDDDIFEEDEHFYVRLSNPRYLGSDVGFGGMNGSLGRLRQCPLLQLAAPSIATVMILDDDHSGVFGFSENQFEIAESSGTFDVPVCRYSGARGRVVVPFRTLDGSAKDGVDYESIEGEIIFDNNETMNNIPIHIIDNESYEKDAVFYLELGDPKLEEDLLKEETGQNVSDNSQNTELTTAEKIALLGKPRIGEQYRCTIRIKESKEFKNTVDKLFQKANVSLALGTSSWKEQFIEAVTVSAGDDRGENDEDDEKRPSCVDYVMHFFTIFWKVLFAFVPPTDYLDGWLSFVTSICIIGLLTAFIGDLASHFGCTLGIKDQVTATAFVALGTSVPDTFASKVAAINDRYADSSIGNVTGSNAVNVFLGIGIAWSIAAIYHAIKGDEFRVNPGSLAFSVTLFCVCAFISCIILFLRRSKMVGGELGGPMKYKIPTTVTFVFLWLFYVLMSSLESYGIIPGF